MENTKTNFLISLSSDNKVDLFYRDRKQTIVSVNDFVNEYIKQNKNTSNSKELLITLNTHIEAVKNGTLDKLYRVKTNTPKFLMLKGKSGIEGDGEWTMKCKHAYNPNDFYLKLPKDQKFIDFVKDLNDYYEKDNPKNAIDIAVEELYLTSYDDQWTRLLILNKIEKFEVIHYSCLLFDKGIVGTIIEKDIFELDDRFKLEPPRSTKSSLACK